MIPNKPSQELATETKTITPDTPPPEDDQKERKPSGGGISFSAPPVETEKEKPGLPKPGFGSGGLFGSKPSGSIPAPTEDKKKAEAPSGGGLFASKPSSEAPKPAVNLFGSKPAETTSDKPAGSLFGAEPATAEPVSLFGPKPAEKTTTAPSSGTGLFGSSSKKQLQPDQLVCLGQLPQKQQLLEISLYQNLLV